MADLLESAVAFAAAALRGNRGKTVLYQRGSDSVSIIATMGATEFERDDGDGVQVAFTAIDFLVSASDIVLSGTMSTPMRGDLIVSDGQTYEVLNITGQQHFTRMDPAGSMLRIHTKLIRTR